MLQSHRRAPPILALALVAAFLVVPDVVLGATYTPTRFDDPIPDGCANNGCSLREAVIAANGVPGSTVQLAAGTYVLSISGTDTPAPNANIGDVDVKVAMTVKGAGMSSTIVRAGASKGNGIDRVFDVYAGPSVISNLTVKWGTARDSPLRGGGCIKNTGGLTLDKVTVTGCTSALGGGGVISFNNLTVRDSIITDNAVSSSNVQVNGGGIAGGPGNGGAPATVTIIRSQITNNVAVYTGSPVNEDGGPFGYGGGFANTAKMIIQDSTISGNVADSSAGGISDPRSMNPDGFITIDGSTFSNNKAVRDAGGMTNDGLATVSDSTFSDNEAGYNCAGADCAQAFAGGFLSSGTGTTNVSNTTFSGNSCGVSGGGVLQSGSGTLRLRSSTIVDNSCGQFAGGISGSSTSVVYLRDTLIANNTAGSHPDCVSTMTSEGYNLIEVVTDACNIVEDTTGNITGLDPMLDPLLDNGGLTRTHALRVGSPAINAGNPDGCWDTAGAALSTDQRGFVRTALTRCDIGAYERQTAGLLWSGGGQAAVSQYMGTGIQGSRGYTGPGPAWLATSYSRDPGGSYQLLWTNNNAAQVVRYLFNNNLLNVRGHTGPGTGWTATSLFGHDDGGYELLWTGDNAAQIWTIKPDGSRGATITKAGPGAGYKATSYWTARDGTRRLLWSMPGQARVWTLSSTGAFLSSTGNQGPSAAGTWTATSYNLNSDGTFNLLWASTDSHIRNWTMNSNGSFNASVGLGGPASETAQSYFFK